MGRGRRAGRHTTGFTLIEILIVVTIIVLVFGLAVPTLTQHLSKVIPKMNWGEASITTRRYGDRIESGDLPGGK